MPDRWAIQWAIEGDLGFLSHHDVMRAMERIARRAKLPLRYSQGFNPRPILSLPCPRPVGVASRDEQLVLALEAPVTPQSLLDRLNEQAPPGMRFVQARLLPPGKSAVHPMCVHYELALDARQTSVVQDRLEQLDRQAAWWVARAAKPVARGKRPAGAPRNLDLRPRVADLSCRQGRLRFTLAPHEQKWAKPGEVLKLVGLEAPENLARLVRTNIQTDV